MGLFHKEFDNFFKKKEKQEIQALFKVELSFSFSLTMTCLTMT